MKTLSERILYSPRGKEVPIRVLARPDGLHVVRHVYVTGPDTYNIVRQVICLSPEVDQAAQALAAWPNYPGDLAFAANWVGERPDFSFPPGKGEASRYWQRRAGEAKGAIWTIGAAERILELRGQR